MNKTKGAFESPEFWSPSHTQSTPLSSVAPPFAFGQQAMDKALNAIITVALFVIMVSLGCTMEIARITTHLRKPKGVAIGVMAQYGIMPLTAFVLGKLFQLGATESLAILNCGCCRGNLSNIFSLALREDMNLSIVMTTCSMLLAIGLLPLLLYLYSGGLYEGDLEGKIPYKGLITSLVLTLIPCAIGINLNERKPQCTGFIIKARKTVLLLVSSAAIIVLSVANMGSGIMAVFSPSLLGSSALMPFIGLLLGYAASAVFKLNDQCRWTVCMETGCQNIQLCSTILKVAFAPETIGHLYFFPLLYLLFQLGEGLLLILVFRIYDRIKTSSGKYSFDPVFRTLSSPNRIHLKYNHQRITAF
ncbi:LOW QUALITY PROTEIN: hepatic sodium/bile acid cotransporter [Ara ararauna]